jgi:tetratricopeptide (TPR) repeat protein
LAQQALKTKDVPRALSLLDQAVSVADGFQQPSVLNVSGLVLMQAQQYDDALIRFDRAASLGDAQAPFNAVKVQVATGRREDARRRLNALTNDRKQRLAAVAQLAALDVEDGKVDAALARLDTLRDIKDSQAQVSELEGDIYFVAKNFTKAAASFERAYQQMPSQRLAIKRYHTLLSFNHAAPQEALQAWLKIAPQDFVVRKFLGQYYVHKHDYDKAIALFEAWLRDSTVRDPEILNDLAWMLWTKGDKRALGFAEEAHKAVPNRPEVADTYGWLLLDAGQVDQALSILKQALTGAADNPEIQYHYAAAQARAGKQADARAALKELLGKHAKFASRSDAEKLLSSLN